MSAQPRELTALWLFYFSGAQIFLIVLAGGWNFYWIHGGKFVLYAMMNLAFATGLSFASVFSKNNDPLVRLALVVATLSFGMLFLTQLVPDSFVEDVLKLTFWIISALALVTIVRRLSLPTCVFLLLMTAILAQGANAISDILDDGSLGQELTSHMYLVNLLAFSVSMAAYYGSSRARKLYQATIARIFRVFGSFHYKKGEVLFMNHGYDPELGSERRLFIPSDLERFRYPIQLYNLVARRVDWISRDALEVSSGLGGGALWISRAYSPATLTGLDVAESAVAKCKKRYGSLGIDFVTGNAQAMPFPDASFDILINIGSSLNYLDMPVFLSEVHRVLRPGGYFLFADYRSESKMSQLRAQLSEMPLETLMLEDVTKGILRGLFNENDWRRDLIDRLTPQFLRNTMKEFAGLGIHESSEYQQFLLRQRIYIAGVFRKSAA